MVYNYDDDYYNHNNNKLSIKMVMMTIVKNLLWRDEETVFPQSIADYILISCIASMIVTVGMTMTYTNRQKLALISCACRILVTSNIKNTFPMNPNNFYADMYALTPTRFIRINIYTYLYQDKYQCGQANRHSSG